MICSALQHPQMRRQSLQVAADDLKYVHMTELTKQHVKRQGIAKAKGEKKNPITLQLH